MLYNKFKAMNGKVDKAHYRSVVQVV